jgi:hypothetical protein
MAADSCVSLETEAGGARKFKCEKLFRKTIGKGRSKKQVILALSGESSPGLLFLDWYGSGVKDPPSQLIDGDADFSALILTDDGLFEADAYCRPERIIEPFYAIGSGAKAALGAMHAGASARRAVEIACRIDPYSTPPIVTMRLK